MIKKVVVVGMLDSVHFARWLSQFEDEELSFTLFPSSPQRTIHPQLKVLLSKRRGASYKLVPLARYFALPLWILDRVFEDFFRAALLRLTLQRIRPEVLHAIELQNAGYLVLRALSGRGLKPRRLILTNYGSDIYWFRRFPKHAEKLKRLLSMADIYSAECNRDVQLARELGFQGQVMPVRPNAGGFSPNILDRHLRPFDSRTRIAVKGYFGWVGRADMALKALELIASEVKDYELVFYSCNLSTVRLAKRLARKSGLKVLTFRKKALSHLEILKIFEEAAVYVGVSESDGISTSMLEAMAMGAIPVQTSTACCDEWFDQTGVKVVRIEAEAVAAAILQGLSLAKDHSNRLKNRETIRAKASAAMVRESALEFYR